MTRLWPKGKLIETWGGKEMPIGFSWQDESHAIEAVYNRWRVHTRWWQPEEAIWREYVKVTTDTGLLCLLYRELLDGRDLSSSTGDWFLARIYD